MSEPLPLVEEPLEDVPDPDEEEPLVEPFSILSEEPLAPEVEPDCAPATAVPRASAAAQAMVRVMASLIDVLPTALFGAAFSDYAPRVNTAAMRSFRHVLAEPWT